MIIYFVFYAFIGIIGYFLYRLDMKREKKAFILCLIWFLSLVLLLGLRHPSMGIDLQYGANNGYLGNFLTISKLTFKELFTKHIQNYEKGFVLLNKLIGFISTNFQFYLFCITFCSLLPVSYMIFKFSDIPLLSLAIYMGLPSFVMLFSGMRQILAIGLCVFSIKYIFNKKIIKFLLIVLLAVFFHRTAIIFLIAYPIYFIKFSKLGRIFSLIPIALVFIFRVPLFSVLSKLFREEAVVDNNGSFGLFLLFVAIYIFCFLFFKEDKTVNGLMNLFLLACICQSFSGIYPTAMRVGFYFMISLVFLLPKATTKIEERKTRIVFYVLISVGFVALGLRTLYGSSFAMANPYFPFWAR